MAVVATSIVGVGIGPTPASAALACGRDEFTQNVWSGPSTALWTNAAYWSQSHVPEAGETVCIPGGKVVNVPDGTTLLSTNPNTTELLIIEGTVRIQAGAHATLANTFYGGFTALNGGTLQLMEGATFDANVDQTTNAAFQNVAPTGMIRVHAGATFTSARQVLNGGTINLTGGGQFVVAGAVSGFRQTTGTVIGGRIHALTGATITYGRGALPVLAEGPMTVKGTMNAQSSLDVICDAAGEATTTIVKMPDGFTNNGPVRFLVPRSGRGTCQSNWQVGTGSGGVTWRNNDSIVFGRKGVVPVGSMVVDSGEWTYGGGAMGGPIVNSKGAKIVVHDRVRWNNNVRNDGVMTTTAVGFIDNLLGSTDNRGTIIMDSPSCDGAIVNRGLIDLRTSCTTTAPVYAVSFTLAPGGTLRVRSSAAGLTGFTTESPTSLAGKLSVVTKGRGPSSGANRLLISGPHTGTFSKVVSEKSGVSYRVTYPADNSGVRLTARRR